MRKKKNLQRTQIHMDKQILDRLDTLAQLKSTSRSQLIRDAVYIYLLREFKKEMTQEKNFHTTLNSITTALGGCL